MNCVQAHAIVQQMPNVMYKTIIQFVFANQAILEIHNMAASNWNVNRMMIVPMTRLALTMNVSTHVCYPILVRLTLNVLV